MNYHRDKDGVFRPAEPVVHREEEYPQAGFQTLAEMQDIHFWYRGRHRFLLKAVDRYLFQSKTSYRGIDLGGGAGGWLRYLTGRRPDGFASLALGDSSAVALGWAEKALPSGVDRYQVDLMNLQMQEQWDAVFLLDVLEHLPDDVGALKEVHKALKPGGYAFMTTPALQQFWSYNDEAAHHLRRYSCRDFAGLAEKSGLKLCDARYFMFFLSPLYLLSRFKPSVRNLSNEERLALVKQQHSVPSKGVNGLLEGVFSAETPLGHWLRFPWGTSVLGVFRKER